MAKQKRFGPMPPIYFLRKKAEEPLDPNPETVDEDLPEHVNGLIHELQIHQAELELENKELRRSQAELEESQRRYTDLYDFAPVGHVTLDEKGVIREANLAAAELFGIERHDLIGRAFADFVAPHFLDAFDLYCKQALETQLREAYESELLREDGTLFDAQLFARSFVEVPNQLRIAISDITQRRRAEEARKEEEVFLNEVIERSPNPLWISDDKGTVVRINQSLRDLLEITDQEIVGKYNVLQDTQVHEQGLLPSIQRVFEKGETVRFTIDYDIGKEAQVELETSLHKVLDITISAIKNHEGKVIHAICQEIDVTERKRVEEALRESEERFRRALENIPDVVVIYDREMRVQYINPATRRITGRPVSDFIGRREEEIWPPEVYQVYLPTLREAFETRTIRSLDTDLLLPDTGLHALHIACVPLVDEKGEVREVLGITHDFTERKRAEEALKERESFNFALFQYNPVPTVVVDLEGRVVKSNLAKRNSGEKLPDLGAAMYRDYEADHEINMRSELMECIRTGAVKEFPELKYGDRFLSVTISPFSQGAMVMSRDVTALKRGAEDMARVKALEELDRWRVALLGSISHELRTPLTVIKGVSSSLVQPDVHWDHETERDLLKTVDEEADRLTHIISDLLDVSRLEAGVMKMKMEKSAFATIVHQIGNELGILVTKHQFEIHIPPGLPMIYADEVRIGQVVTNLVSNAANYSAEGSRITLEARHVGTELVVSVTDQGIGIPAEHLGKIFNKFYRLEAGVKRRRGGSGLGLSICKGIIEANNGRIWVESIPGNGSKFSFALPIADRIEH